MSHRLLGGISATVAVLTLALGLLAGLSVGFEAAAAVMIVGSSLVTPLVPIVGNEVVPALRDRRRESGAESVDADDPLAELKTHSARGEIGDDEFERRIERLVELEGVGRGRGAEEWTGSCRSNGSEKRTEQHSTAVRPPIPRT